MLGKFEENEWFLIQFRPPVFDCLFELNLVSDIGFLMARPCCPAGHTGLLQQVIRVGFVILDAVLFFDMMQQELRLPSLLVVAEFGRWSLELLEQLGPQSIDFGFSALYAASKEACSIG